MAQKAENTESTCVSEGGCESVSDMESDYDYGDGFVDRLCYIDESYIGKDVTFMGRVTNIRYRVPKYNEDESAMIRAGLVYIDVDDGSMIHKPRTNSRGVLMFEPLRLVVHQNTTQETFAEGMKDETPKEIMYCGQNKGDELSFTDMADMYKIYNACSVRVLGHVAKAPENVSQDFEIKVLKLEVIGKSNPDEYPLKRNVMKDPKKMRVYKERHVTPVKQAIYMLASLVQTIFNTYFFEQNIPKVNVPIITLSDCEGAGEFFGISPQFFGPGGKPGKYLAKMSGSGQSLLEEMRMSAYIFQHCFRAEKSDTSSHLAEFWMLEAEFWPLTLKKLIDGVEELMKRIIKDSLNMGAKYYAVLNDKKLAAPYFHGHDEFIRSLLDRPFVRIKYSDAIDLMLEDLRSGTRHIGPSGKMVKLKFKVLPKHGEDLAKEHEMYLLEKFGTFVFVTHWPLNIKAYYMKQVPDGTCESFDLLAPGVGELFGGSMREEVHEKLESELEKRAMDTEDPAVSSYLGIRKHGSIPHGGWGMGFERLMVFLTGALSVRDVTTFPTYYGYCNH